MTFEEMGNLEQGWDGEKARPITKEAIDTAKAFLARMEFTPLPDGGIDIEFELPGVHLGTHSLLVVVSPNGSYVSRYFKEKAEN
jgi:hypothetical protein